MTAIDSQFFDQFSVARQKGIQVDVLDLIFQAVFLNQFIQFSNLLIVVFGTVFQDS